MTRFDADDPAERRKLYAEAIRAHRQRGSPFLTIEVHREDDSPPGIGDGPDAPELQEVEFEDPTEGPPPDASEDEADLPPWVQFGDGLVNVDCTDAEYDLLTDLLDEYPAFRIDEQNRPDSAEGTNVRISARADENRIAAFLDDVFVRVYDQPSDYRAWVVEI